MRPILDELRARRTSSGVSARGAPERLSGRTAGESRAASYRFTDASGRFAVFDRAVVDLASERVAWAWNHDPSIVPVLAAKGQLLRRLFEGRQAVQLWSLLDGSYGPSFDGALVPTSPRQGAWRCREPKR